MEVLRDIEMQGASITEYCGNEQEGTYDASSAITNAHVNDIGELVVDCQDFGPEGRTIVFSPQSWNCEILGDMVFLNRIAPDTGKVDMPTHSVNRYMIDEFLMNTDE